MSTDKSQYISVITNLPSEKSEKYISQTIEKLMDGIVPSEQSEEYTIVLIAEPVSDCLSIQDRLCDEYSLLAPYAAVQGTKTLNETYGISSAASHGLAAGVQLGKGGFSGNVGGHLDYTISVQESAGKSDGVTRTYTDYSVKHMLETLEKQIQRIDQCKATGMWDYAAYVFSLNSNVVDRVSHMYDSLTKGENSFLSSSAINTWTKAEEDDREQIINYVSLLEHPKFQLKEPNNHDSVLLPLEIRTTAMVSTVELAHAMNLPRESVPGFPVTECAAFGRSISLLDGSNESPSDIEVGEIWHMRKADGGKVKLDTNLLTSHVFITGSTGSGKSNTVYQLLAKLKEEGKKYLVIEPTKGEYKAVFGGRDDVSVYGTNYKKTDLLRINPFSFPEGVQLYAHMDRLTEIFNACWPMYAAMPAVLKDAMERAYVDAGWNLTTSENPCGRLFPSFVDVLRQIDIVMNESDYSGESKGDYKGALKTRLKSLTNGIYSQVFTSNELSEKELFDNNVIVDLSEVGMETTSLIMGILVLKLHEYRMASKAINSELKHVTVLEEAHNLLKRTSTEQSAEGSNLVGKSVEMITNAIAEMRTYGECFMIVDQAPGALDSAAIRNTNTKIVLRLPDFSDRELVGKSIGLNEYQITELSKLERGVAAVYQSGWIESVLCKFNRFDEKNEFPGARTEYKTDKSAGILLNAVLYGTRVSEFANAIRAFRDDLVYKSSLPVALRCQIQKACNDDKPISQETLASFAYELLDADTLYAKKEDPSGADFAHVFAQALRRYQISDLALKENNLNVLIDLLNQERCRRETEFVYGALRGGVY